MDFQERHLHTSAHMVICTLALLEKLQDGPAGKSHLQSTHAKWIDIYRCGDIII